MVVAALLFFLPFAVFAGSVMWTRFSSSQIAQEHREHVSAVRDQVLRERLQQRQAAAISSGQAQQNSSGPPPYSPAYAASASSSSFSSSSSSPASPLPSAPLLHPESSPSPSAPPPPSAAPTASPRVPSRDCPICLESASFAVETNCAHLYCAQCFLEYFERGSASASIVPQAVVCPCCRRRVDALVTRFTLQEETAEAMPALLSRVQRYNTKFSGQPRSLRDSLEDTPTYLRRLVADVAASPASAIPLLFRTHFLLSLVGTLLYVFSPFDLLPELVFGVLGLVDDALIIVAVCVFAAGIYRTATLGRQAAQRA